MNELNPNVADPMVDIFNVGADAYNNAVQTEDDVQGNDDFYRPKLEGDIKVYKGRLRWLPNIKNPAVSVISKWGYWFSNDPENPNRSVWMDCTSNAGGKPNIFTNAFFTCRDSDSAAISQLARNFGRKQYHWMLVYIMLDSQKPELQGKVKIMRFGNQIKDMHKKELDGDPAVGSKGVVFYHPFTGKDFVLTINEKTIPKKSGSGTYTITNYDDSYFMPAQVPFGFIQEGDEDFRRVQNTPESRQELTEFLQNESPELEQMAYVPWNESDHERAVLITKTLLNNVNLFNKVYRKTYGNNNQYAIAAKQKQQDGSHEDAAAPNVGNLEDQADQAPASVEEIANKLSATPDTGTPGAADTKAQAAPMDNSDFDESFDDFDNTDFDTDFGDVNLDELLDE